MIDSSEREPNPILPPSSPPNDNDYSSPNPAPLMSEFDFWTNPTTSFQVPKSPKQQHQQQRQHATELKTSPHKPISSDADFGIDRFNRFRGSFNEVKSKNKNQNSFSTTSDAGRDKKAGPGKRNGIEKNAKNFFGAAEEENDDDKDEDDEDDNTDDEATRIARTRAFNRARDILLDAFENAQTVIDLNSMGLDQVPDEIKDLNNLVIIPGLTTGFNSLVESQYQLYLTNNSIYDLAPSLFKFTKLQVLSLRQNKLTSIPPLIANLANLSDLSISSNRIEFLPSQVLNLPKLKNLTTGPNPFIKVPQDAIIIPKKENNDDSFLSVLTLHTLYLLPLSHLQQLQLQLQPQLQFAPSLCTAKAQIRARTTIKYLTTKTRKVVSLRSLCLNVIAKYDVSYQETQIWKKSTPKIFHSTIAKAIRKGKFMDKCNECDLIVVEPMAEVMEWWDILQNKNVPIRRQFCSDHCVQKYLLNKEEASNF